MATTPQVFRPLPLAGETEHRRRVPPLTGAWTRSLAAWRMIAMCAVIAAGVLGGPTAVCATAGENQGRFDVAQFGATGQRADNATVALQRAIDACAAAGGGMVYVPPGAYTTGAIHLKDNVNLHLEAGATFYLSQDPADFTLERRAMINANGAKNIALTGRGSIDGLARYEFADERGDDPEIAEEQEIARRAGVPMKRYYRVGMQTYLLVLNDSTDVRLEDITLLNSPLWTVRLDHCDRVFVRGVHISSDLEKGVNSDGIDIVSTRNVLISDSIISTADDAIVLKAEGRSGRPAAPVENVVVTNCILTSSSTALMIGTETEADIRHVLFSHCVIRDSNKGIGINVQDGATVSDVVFRDLTIDTRRRHWNWWGSAEALKFVLKKRTAESKLGVIRDIVVDNVIAHVRGTSTITSHADRPLENIAISDFQVFMLPEDVPDKRATDAVGIDGVKGLTLRNVSVAWADDRPEPRWGSALHVTNVSDLQIDRFAGRQGLRDGKAAAVVLESVRDAMISDSRAGAGTGTFLEVRGAHNHGLRLRDNDLSRAAAPSAFTEGAAPAAVVAP